MTGVPNVDCSFGLFASSVLDSLVSHIPGKLLRKVQLVVSDIFQVNARDSRVEQ
jgi:hypothetical protein